MAIEDVLFPGIDVRVTAVHAAVEGVVVEAAACGRPPDCPSCDCAGRRVHSRYRRSLAERTVAGRSLVTSLRVRRFFCERAGCRRRTFVEQVPDLSERYRRHSIGLRQWMRSITTFVGGRLGKRLCQILQLPTGRTHLLGLLTDPPVPERAPRVLGVDEFAFRKGWRYGTVLVDVEAARAVDVLPGRDAVTFAAWLNCHRCGAAGRCPLRPSQGGVPP
ncbi:transposase [Streptomyces sp. NPDC059009]|uniref:transposase n=1 Tax=Streptomyces sp. NPDC059009 TaxID=3346694 RepID=UPI0036A117D9